LDLGGHPVAPHVALQPGIGGINTLAKPHAVHAKTLTQSITENNVAANFDHPKCKARQTPDIAKNNRQSSDNGNWTKVHAWIAASPLTNAQSFALTATTETQAKKASQSVTKSAVKAPNKSLKNSQNAMPSAATATPYAPTTKGTT